LTFPVDFSLTGYPWR